MFYFALIPFRFSISEISSEVSIKNSIKISYLFKVFDILENFPVQIKSVTSEKELSQIDQARDLSCFIIFVAITVLNENFHTTEIIVIKIHYIDDDDGCWRRNVLVTTIRCW